MSMSVSQENRPKSISPTKCLPPPIKYVAGDVITSADPFVHVLNPEIRGQRCDYCLQKPDMDKKLKRCSGCSLFHYCDRKCQILDWKTYHKHGECDFYTKLSQCQKKEVKDVFQWNHYVSCSLRLLLLVKAHPQLMSKKFKLHDGGERSLDDLMDDEHDADKTGRNPLKFHLIYSTLSQVEDSPVTLADFGLLKSLVNKLRINSFSIDNMDDANLVNGHGMYIETSVFDHSCRANAAYIFQGKRMEVRAMRDIRQGEEVTIAYVDQMIAKKLRQETLWKGWGFHCTCSRCQEEETDQELAEMAENFQYHEGLTVAQLDLLSEAEQVHFIFHGLMKVLPYKEKYLGPFHPLTTNIMYRAANAICHKKQMTKDETKDFMILVTKLQQAALVTHGRDHEFFFMIPFLRNWAGLTLR